MHGSKLDILWSAPADGYQTESQEHDRHRIASQSSQQAVLQDYRIGGLLLW